MLAAFVAVGDTFLVVFVGIFLALVFEGPVRYLMAKTGMSRGIAATVMVLGTAVAVLVIALVFLVPLVGGVRDFIQDLPMLVEQLRESDELSWLGDSGAAENVQQGADEASASVPDAISALLGIAGSLFTGFLVCFTIIFICIFLLSDVVNLKRALASMLMPGEDERWLGVWERVTTSILALGDRRRRDRRDRRDDSGGHGLATRLELRGRPGGHRRPPRHDPEPRRHHRRRHPRAGDPGRGGPAPRSSCSSCCSSTSRSRTTS